MVALYPVPPPLARLSEAVQRSYSQHGELSAQREPVKNSFRMTLTLVLLLAMLTAIYGAIYSAEKLVRPVQDLIAGTRAVGKGDFGTRLPLPSRDEMGFLVHSFNDMTKRLRRAREETTRSQQAVERERERLSIILARLTTGVIAIGRDLVLRSANHSASSILGVDLEQGIGLPLSALVEDNPRYARFVAEVTARLARGEEEWREQMELKPELSGPRVLVCACTPLPGNERRGAPGRLRHRLRRHQRAAAGAARRSMGRSSAAPGPRDQEPAHADPALRRADAAALPRTHAG